MDKLEIRLTLSRARDIVRTVTAPLASTLAGPDSSGTVDITSGSVALTSIAAVSMSAVKCK